MALRDLDTRMSTSHAIQATEPPLFNAVITDRLIKIKELVTLTGLSRATIYRRQSEGCFPHAIAISARRVAWRATDVNRWLAMARPADFQT